MKADLEAATRAFRMGEIARGSAALTRFIDAFALLLPRLQGTPKDKQIMETVLTALAAAQQRGDYNYVADVLEHHLQPLF